MIPNEPTARALTQTKVLPPCYTTWRPYGPAADLDLNHWTNLPQPDNGKAFTSPVRMLEALEGEKWKFGLAGRIMRAFRKSKLDHLLIGQGATIISEDGSHRRASKREASKIIDRAKDTEEFKQATALAVRMFKCLLTDEKFWTLLSKEPDARRVTDFIRERFRLQLPPAVPRVWARIASEPRLRDRFIKVLLERPNLVAGWVQVTSLERNCPAISAEVVRLFMTRLNRPHRSIRSDLACSSIPSELLLRLADAAKQFAADAQGDASADDFKLRANRQLPTIVHAEDMEQMITVVAGCSVRNASALAKSFHKDKAAARKGKSLDAWRLDFGVAIRIHKLRTVLLNSPIPRFSRMRPATLGRGLPQSRPLRSEISD